MSAEFLQTLIGPEVTASLVGAVATIAAGGVAAYLVVWQIGEQARLAIQQNKENEAIKLKLRVYEEVSAICARASDAQIEFASYVRSFASNLNLVNQLQKQGAPWSPPRERIPELLELSQRFEHLAVDVIFATERWQIIDNRIDIFRYALNAALHDVRESYRQYFNFAVTAMPMEVPAEQPGQGRLFPWRIPIMTNAEQLSGELIDALDTCGSYFGDMQLEMQNLLLGDLFGNSVPPRVPLDPKFIAVRFDRYDALKEYFETQTAWGKNSQRVFAEIRERVAREAEGKNRA